MKRLTQKSFGETSKVTRSTDNPRIEHHYKYLFSRKHFVASRKKRGRLQNKVVKGNKNLVVFS